MLKKCRSGKETWCTKRKFKQTIFVFPLTGWVSERDIFRLRNVLKLSWNVRTYSFPLWVRFCESMWKSKKKGMISVSYVLILVWRHKIHLSLPLPLSLSRFADNDSFAVFLLIKKVKRLEEEHFPGSTSSIERPLILYSDNQDINVWLDENALTNRGWTLDETPALQVKWLPSCTPICLDALMIVGTFPP